jgi:flagellar assembly protein FliH
MKNDNILYPEELEKHKIDDYVFKKINTSNKIIKKNKNNYQEDKDNNIIDQLENNYPEGSSDDLNNVIKEDIEQISSFHTNMMDKIEQLSTKLNDVQTSVLNQPQSEGNTEATTQQLQQSYQDGFNAGKKEALENKSQEIDEEKGRFTQSIDSIGEYVQKAESVISSLENELVRVSMDIAQEIIQTQIEQSSQNIASTLAHNLLTDLNDATKITIKVSVYDYDYVLEHMKDDRVIVEKDLAIAKGGVMIFSDTLNIDGTIKERFSKIKTAFYEEHK